MPRDQGCHFSPSSLIQIASKHLFGSQVFVPLIRINVCGTILCYLFNINNFKTAEGARCCKVITPLIQINDYCKGGIMSVGENVLLETGGKFPGENVRRGKCSKEKLSRGKLSVPQIVYILRNITRIFERDKQERI